MNRFLFECSNNKKKLKQAAKIQFSIKQPPIIYYGTEVGLSQTVSKSSETGLETSRMAMLWDDRQDLDLLATYQEMIAERANVKPWAKNEPMG